MLKAIAGAGIEILTFVVRNEDDRLGLLLSAALLGRSEWKMQMTDLIEG